MRSPRWRKVVRDAWLHKARTLLVVLAIAVGIAGAGTILTRWAIVRAVVDQGYAASNPASATLRVDTVDAAVLAAVRALPEVAELQAGRTIAARARVAGSWANLVLFVRDDFERTPIARLIPEAGAWPPADGTLVIERSSLDLAGVGVGESLLVALGDREPTALPVSGIARDVGLAPGWMEHLVYAFVTPATLESLGGPRILNQVLLVTADRSLDRDGVRAVAFRTRTAIHATGRTVEDIEVPEPGEHIHAGQINSMLVTQGGFGILTLVLSALLALTLVEAMLAGQVREIGIMKTLGARSGQIAAMYLVFAGLVGLVAALLALPVSAAAGTAYAELTASMLNFDARSASVPGWVLLAQIAIGVALPITAAAVPVIRGSRMPAGEALRDIGMTADGRAGRLLARAGGLTRPLLLSLRNAFRRRLRMARTLLTLAMSGGILMGALHLKASIRETMDRSFRAMRYEMSIGVEPAMTAAALEQVVAAVPGVARVQAWSGGSAAVARTDGTWGDRFAISAVPADTRFIEFSMVSGRWLGDGGRGEIVVGARLQDVEPALSVGAIVTLRIGQRLSQWTVVGVLPAVIGSAFVTQEAWAAATGDSLVSRAVVALADTGVVAQSETRRAVHATLSSSGIQVGSTLVAENRAAVEDHLLLVADFLSAMGWLMLVVGGLGLASTMSLAVLERTREIGVLRAIGARHSSIHFLVQAEGLVVALLSWALAIPLSVPMARILGDAFGRIFFRTPIALVPDPRGVAIWLGVVIVVSLVACAWPAFRATRISARSALAYE
jgi:putative ABC transport system permease protein